MAKHLHFSEETYVSPDSSPRLAAIHEGGDRPGVLSPAPATPTSGGIAVETREEDNSFQACYERFLAQESSASQEDDAVLVPPPLAQPAAPQPIRQDDWLFQEQEAVLRDFQACYERFVGYPVDRELFTAGNALYHYHRPEQRFATAKRLLKGGLMGVGSVVATVAIGTLLVRSSDRPTYSFRDYSPELFQHRELDARQTASNPAASSTFEVNAAPLSQDLSSSEPTQTRSVVPARQVPQYSIVPLNSGTIPPTLETWPQDLASSTPQVPTVPSDAQAEMIRLQEALPQTPSPAPGEPLSSDSILEGIEPASFFPEPTPGMVPEAGPGAPLGEAQSTGAELSLPPAWLTESLTIDPRIALRRLGEPQSERTDDD
jgi:hypothetical protein